MKIYTKLGDKGETSLVGGKRVSKHHPRIEAYGTIDELISFIAVIMDSDISENQKSMLLNIQKNLMDCTAILANDGNGQKMKFPTINQDDIYTLEKEIDKMDNVMPKLNSFILPGGHMASSYCHVARNICRRAERNISLLSETHTVDEMLKKYINRLSDFLFVLARKILYDKGIEEILWK